MSKVLVLYYSSYGHIEAMANAVAEGARQAGAHVDVKRVPELVPEEIARKSHYKFDQEAPIAKVEDLAAYDAIIIGAGTQNGDCRRRWPISSTRPEDFGLAERCTARSAARSRRAPRNMADRRRRCSRSSPIFCTLAWWLWASITAMPGQMTLDEITGGSPYGATTITGGDGSRLPTANEPARGSPALHQGRKIVRETANKLHRLMPSSHPIGTMWMANGCSVCDGNGEGPGAAAPGRSHRGHGDPVAAELLQETAVVSRQAPLWARSSIPRGIDARAGACDFWRRRGERPRRVAAVAHS